MVWYEPKEKTARIDWRCDTPYYNFKIINIDNDNLALFDAKRNSLIKLSTDIDTLHFCAFDLNLRWEREER